MSRKRIGAWGMLLATTLSVRATVAAPHAAALELRAVACCIEHCPPAQRRPMQAQRCCNLQSDAGDPAALSSLAAAPTPDPGVATPVAPWAPRPSSRMALTSPVRMTTGPPPYQRTQKLQR